MPSRLKPASVSTWLWDAVEWWALGLIGSDTMAA